MDPQPSSAPPGARRLGRRPAALLAFLVLAGALAWDLGFTRRFATDVVLQMSDVDAILRGYRATPNLLIDGLRWWHGPWIREGIQAFRPLSSYLLWIDLWLGLHLGWNSMGWLGFFLFLPTCWVAVLLAWRITRSRLCAALAGLLVTRITILGRSTGHPSFWLFWFPCHPEVLMILLVLAALILWDRWCERGERKDLAGAWALFLAACLTKEHAYIFPVCAAAFALLRRPRAPGGTRRGLVQSGAMLAAMLPLWLYRASILPHAYNPTLKPQQFIDKPIHFLYAPAALYFRSTMDWRLGLPILVFLLGAAFVKLRRLPGAARWTNPWLFVPLSLGILALYLHVASESVVVSTYITLDLTAPDPYLPKAAIMIAILYVFTLCWKYRQTEPAFAMLVVTALWYIPLLDYGGWHYLISPWFLRCVFFAALARVVWAELLNAAPLLGLGYRRVEERLMPVLFPPAEPG